MNYGIYKTSDGKHAHIVHTFTQEACNHKAKRAAQEKLDEMWLRVLNQPDGVRRNPHGERDEFEYDHMTSSHTKERIRFYIAPIHQSNK